MAVQKNRTTPTRRGMRRSILLQLATVIEDEILSAMPLAPSHHRSEECGKLVAVYERVADSPSAGAREQALFRFGRFNWKSRSAGEVTN